MIDNVKLVTRVKLFPLCTCENMPQFVIVGNLKLIAVKSLKDFKIIKYQCMHKNLLITLVKDELRITNSIHKFSKANNYSNFTYNELFESITKIEKLTEISASKFEIKKLEFGLNIEVPFKTENYLLNFSDYKGKNPEKMMSSNTSYGIKYFFTEYNIKIYDKEKQVKICDRINIDQNLLRIEIQYSKQRKLSVINYLSELKEKNKLRELFNSFKKIIEKINCKGDEDFTNFKNSERELYFAGSNDRYWANLRAHNINTFKNNRKRYKDIQQNVNIKDFISSIMDTLNKKFNILIDS